MDEYHHYIPQFILRKFNIQKNVKNKKNIKIKYYNIKDNKLEICKTIRKYGVYNLYKDLNSEKVMEVEKELSKLENKCSNIINTILESNKHIEIKKKKMDELIKFLYIMMYRKKSRKEQYLESNFDDTTKDILDEFMYKHNMKNYEDIWLNNIKELLKTDHNQIKYNNKISPIIKTEYIEIINFNFICIWKAKDVEFIITSKCFGIHEGKLPFTYHIFFVLSPKYIIVLSNKCFKKNKEYHIIKNFNMNKSMFPKNIHLYPIEKQIDDNKHENISEIKIKEIDDKMVYLVNSIFLEEENESITFVSGDNLYESIKFYENCKHLVLQRNYNNLKGILNKTFNNNEINTKCFPYDEKINKHDILYVLKYNNEYFFKEIIKNENYEIKDVEMFWNMLDLPKKVTLSEGIIIKLKKIIEDYLIIINIKNNKEKIMDIMNFIRIRFVLIICNNMKDNDISNIKYISDFYNIVYKASDNVIKRIDNIIPYNKNIDHYLPEINIEDNLYKECVKELIRKVGGYNLDINHEKDEIEYKLKEKYKKSVIYNIEIWLFTERPDIIILLN